MVQGMRVAQEDRGTVVKMKNLKRLALLSLVTAALVISPIPGTKADHNSSEKTFSLQQVLAHEDYKLQWPLDSFVITQGFGENKGTHYRNGHLGLDMMSYFGAPVKAAADGIVVAKGSDECPNFEQPECNYRLGNWVMLWHPKLELHTVYSHLKEKPDKDINLELRQGEVIGHEGGSGYQFKTSDGKQVTGDPSCHHLDFMVGVFKPYKTFEGKTDFQLVKVYNPLEFLPPLDNISK